MSGLDAFDAPAKAAGVDQATRALGVLASAFKQGGEASRSTIEIQTSALERALGATAALSDRVVAMSEFVTRAAEQSTAIARISAERDIKIAEMGANKDFEAKMWGLVEGPVGKAVLGKLGFVPNLSNEQKTAVGNVLTRFFAHDQACSAVQSENEAEYAMFLEFVKTLV